MRYKTFGGSGSDSLIVETEDMYLLAVGYSSLNNNDITDSNNGNYNGLILKFNQNGSVIIDLTFVGSKIEKLLIVVQTSKKDFITVGH